MPLEKGSSEETLKKNISEMLAAGHPEKQALAAAYQQQWSSTKDGMANEELIARIKVIIAEANG